MPIPTQDLKAHHAPLNERLNQAALRVIASGRYIMGPEIEAFEKEAGIACGSRHAIGVSSGTDALIVALMALGVGPGDEVVTTPFTFFATAGAIARLNAKPVFVDILPDTLNIDPQKAAAAINPRTKAVITVDLFGRVAGTDGLRELCASRRIPIIEDAAQSIGARIGADGPAVGKIGLCATLSFFPAKNLGCLGDAGMVLTDDDAFADRVRILRVHGGERRYFHQVVGGNFRIDELQAAFLRVKLPELPRWTAARRALAARYHEKLAGLAGRIILPPPDAGSVWNQYVIRVPGGKRDALQKHLDALGTGTAIYYPLPLHLQECWRPLSYKAGDLPIAEQACDEVLALPIYPEMPPAHLDEVSAQIASFVGK
jgi:dTDP-4-amino-4,6-dideoxygalactose transaminase